MATVINHSWKNGGDPSSKPEVLVLNNGHILITSDADTDADGSPDADKIDPSGQKETALGKDNGWQGDGEYVNARVVPYFVLPSNWLAITNIACRLGDIAKLTFGNQVVYAIYADVGPTSIIGEASIAAVESLGHNPWTSQHTQIVSGIPHGVKYEIIPRSSDLSQTINFETIQAYGKSMFGTTQPAPLDCPEAAITWLELSRLPNGTPAVIAYAGSEPKFTRYYKTKESLVGFLQTFPNARTVLVADDKPIPECPDYEKAVETVDSAKKFISYFQQNYGAVRAEVERWFIDDIPRRWSIDAVKNSCVAHQVSCLKLCSLPCPPLDTIPSVNVNAFVKWALAHDWSKVDDMKEMKPGDICVSGPSNEDPDHVYCFVKYIDDENAYVLHNQLFGLAVRSLIGNGCGPWQFALRMP
jgi:hypothetical protein